MAEPEGLGPQRPVGNPLIDALEAALRERRLEKAAAKGPPEDDDAVLRDLMRAGTAKGSSKPEQLLTLDSKTQKGVIAMRQKHTHTRTLTHSHTHTHKHSVNYATATAAIIITTVTSYVLLRSLPPLLPYKSIFWGRTRGRGPAAWVAARRSTRAMAWSALMSGVSRLPSSTLSWLKGMMSVQLESPFRRRRRR